MREQREAHPQQPTGAAGVYPRSYLIDHRPAGIFDPEAPELAVLARLWPCMSNTWDCRFPYLRLSRTFACSDITRTAPPPSLS